MNAIIEWLESQKIQPLVIGAIAALITSLITWRYRRKDLYNQLLKEQITAAYSVVNDLLLLNEIFNDKYKNIVGKKLAEHLMAGKSIDDFQYDFFQTQLLLEIQPEHQSLFRQVTSKAFIFPQQLQKLMVIPFEKIANLFENNNDANLGFELLQLGNDIANLVDELNHYFKIDKLSKQMKRRL